MSYLQSSYDEDESLRQPHPIPARLTVHTDISIVMASWIVETRTNTRLTANCPKCSHRHSDTQAHSGARGT